MSIKDKRKRIEEKILSMCKDIDKKGDNYKLYKEMFDKMSDEEFAKWMDRMSKGEIHLTLRVPARMKDSGIDFVNNLKLGPKYGVNFFERLTYKDANPPYTPDIKNRIFVNIVRRTTQLHSKGINYAKHLKVRNAITGQVTSSVSKSTKLTKPEMNVLASIGLTKTIEEFTTIRGGDVSGSNALRNKLALDGEVSMDELEAYRRTTGSTNAVKKYFRAIHIDLEE